MSTEEKDMFKKYVRKSNIYFEFGLGGSTVFACQSKNINKVFCVESDRAWIRKVKSEIRKCKITFIYVDINANPNNWGRPIDKSKIKNWPKYSSSILEIEYIPDLVLIDGRFRVACAINAFKVIHNDGIILMHDYNRKGYHVVEKFLKPVNCAGSLQAFRKRENVNMEELKKCLNKNLLKVA